MVQLATKRAMGEESEDGPMTVDIAQIVRVRNKIDAKRKANAAAFREADAKAKAAQEELETFLLGYLNETGVKSVRTDEGTFFRETKVIPRGEDWDAFYTWVREHDAFDAFEKRITESFIKDYMAKNHDTLPPGVTVFSQVKIRFRSPTAKVGDLTDD